MIDNYFKLFSLLLKLSFDVLIMLNLHKNTEN